MRSSVASVFHSTQSVLFVSICFAIMIVLQPTIMLVDSCGVKLVFSFAVLFFALFILERAYNLWYVRCQLVENGQKKPCRMYVKLVFASLLMW